VCQYAGKSILAHWHEQLRERERGEGKKVEERDQEKKRGRKRKVTGEMSDRGRERKRVRLVFFENVIVWYILLCLFFK